MHNWSDEELDRISREAAQRYEPPMPEGGWEALSRKLDVEMPRKEKKRRFFWLFFTGLLLSGGVWWMTHEGKAPTMPAMTKVQSGTHQNNEPSVGTGTTATKVPAQKTAPIGEKVENTTQAEDKANAVPTYSSNTAIPSTPVDRVVHGQVTGAPQGAGADRKSKVQQHQGKVPPANAGNRDDLPVPARSVSEKKERSPVSPAVPSSSPDVEIGKKEEVHNSGTDIPEANTAVSDKTPSAPAVPEAKDTTVAPKTETPKLAPASIRKRSRWEFTAALAPDLSTVEFYPAAQVGYVVGAGVGFHLSERWTLGTGLYYTVKYYDAPGDAYHLPPGYWTNNPYLKMNSVEAICNMWDIPLNIRYDITNGKKQRFFVSTGISSYLMRKEDLHYYYTYNNNPNDRSYVYKKNTNYWLAIGNISAGFEQQLGKGFSLQAEPFAKFSLSDVGYGKVRLNSYGLFVGIKYRPYKTVHPHH